MPLVAPVSFGQRLQTNATASSRNGTVVAAGATAHTKNATYTQLIASTDFDVWGIALGILNVATANTNTAFLLDVAIGAAGSERVILPNLSCWGAPAAAGAREYVLPIHLPAGVRVAATGQSVIVSDTANVLIWLYQKNPYPWFVSRLTDYGTVLASSRGTSVLPGNGVFGSWTQIATSTSRDHWLWMVSFDGLDDSTEALINYLVEFGHGPSSTTVQSIATVAFSTETSESIGGPIPAVPIYHPVPSGSGLWARIAAGATPENRGIIIYGAD